MTIQQKSVIASKSAAAGIGTLILFIAFILVAAISAAVLISTGGALQSKSLQTGSKTTQQVSNGVSVLALYGENASLNPTIGYLYATIRLNPGSNSITLNDSGVDVFTGKFSQSYAFNQSGNCSQSWLTNLAYSTSYFAVEGQQGYKISGLMQEGDVLLVCTRLTNTVAESATVSWQFTPKNGVFTKVKTQTPNVMSTAKTFLYP